VTFTSPLRREDPPDIAPEREALATYLDFHRATLLMKLEGLDDEQLRRPMVPSGVCLLGLVKHLTQVEHSWFSRVIGRSGEPFLYSTREDPGADFRIEEGETTEAVVAGYLRACARSREIYAATESLDEIRPHHRLPIEMDVRTIMIHMIEETARHNGHADIIRELIDGATGV
jgi:uncharacterized damage-inducible protein DinB